MKCHLKPIVSTVCVVLLRKVWSKDSENYRGGGVVGKKERLGVARAVGGAARQELSYI